MQCTKYGKKAVWEQLPSAASEETLTEKIYELKAATEESLNGLKTAAEENTNDFRNMMMKLLPPRKSK